MLRGPLSSYNNLLKKGQLTSDAHQLLTINKLQDLYSKVINYTPPAITKPILQTTSSTLSDSLKSPDFAWIEQQSYWTKVR